VSVRRARGEGTVYRYRTGWAAQVVLGEPGRPRRRRTVYGTTQREVLDRVRELRESAARGLPLERSATLTVARYLQTWLTVTLPGRIAAGQLRESTLDGYRDDVTRHLLPALGHHPLLGLTPQHVRFWQTAKLGETSADTGRQLSPSSVRGYHATLRAALSDAMRDELVDRNVAMLVRPAPRPLAGGLADGRRRHGAAGSDRQ
jgi:integrase